MSQNLEPPKFMHQPWHCPFCQKSEEHKLGLRGGKFHRYRLGEVSTIVACGSCGLLYPNPFPIPEDPQKLYGNVESYFAAHPEDKKNQVCLEFMQKLRPRFGAQPKHLDVGSGRGELVAAGVRAGFDSMGTEFSHAMIQYAADTNKVTLHKLSIEEAAEKWPGNFDLVTLSAILEHVYDPNSMLQAASKLLKKGGILYIDVPNEPSLLTRMGNFWNSLRGNEGVYNLSPTWPPYHVYGFNPGALKVGLEKNGFSVDTVRVWAHPVIRSNGTWRDAFRSFVATQINRLANLTGTAGNLEVWAKRN